MKILSLVCLIVAISTPVYAIDSELYQKYRAYKDRQQTTQDQVLRQARTALDNGDLAAAQKHLDTARHLAYAPDEISALEQDIAAEKERREQVRLAEEQRLREEQERIAREQREREEQARLAEQQRQQQAEQLRQAQLYRQQLP
jgi:hypothetical protein